MNYLYTFLGLGVGIVSFNTLNLHVSSMPVISGICSFLFAMIWTWYITMDQRDREKENKFWRSIGLE